MPRKNSAVVDGPSLGASVIRLFLAGDVMLGRGIDQILRHPADSWLWESHMHSANDYVRLAEIVKGPIPRSRGLDYV